jgi:hypothetical protein
MGGGGVFSGAGGRDTNCSCFQLRTADETLCCRLCCDVTYFNFVVDVILPYALGKLLANF